MRLMVGVTAAALLWGSSAGAVTLFSDNFDAEPAPLGYALNYNSFANFFVADGTVDLLRTGNSFGLPGVGGFVDLDGSSKDAGYIETIQQFDVFAGQVVTLSFDVAGNQRGSAPDNLFGGFRFFSPISLGAISFSGFEAIQQPAPLLIGTLANLSSDAGYSTYSISFRALTSGSVSALVGTGGQDNQGPLLDNFRITVVPEPTTWAMMILGFAAVGSAIRRRRAGLRPAFT